MKISIERIGKEERDEQEVAADAPPAVAAVVNDDIPIAQHRTIMKLTDNHLDTL